MCCSAWWALEICLRPSLQAFGAVPCQRPVADTPQAMDRATALAKAAAAYEKAAQAYELAAAGAEVVEPPVVDSVQVAKSSEVVAMLAPQPKSRSRREPSLLSIRSSSGVPDNRMLGARRQVQRACSPPPPPPPAVFNRERFEGLPERGPSVVADDPSHWRPRPSYEGDDMAWSGAKPPDEHQRDREGQHLPPGQWDRSRSPTTILQRGRRHRRRASPKLQRRLRTPEPVRDAPLAPPVPSRSCQERISRRLSAILRHGRAATAVAVDSHGFAEAQALAREMRESEPAVVFVGRTSQCRGTPRFEVLEWQQTLYIRAVNKHSISIIEASGLGDETAGEQSALVHGLAEPPRATPWIFVGDNVAPKTAGNRRTQRRAEQRARKQELQDVGLAAAAVAFDAEPEAPAGRPPHTLRESFTSLSLPTSSAGPSPMLVAAGAVIAACSDRPLVAEPYTPTDAVGAGAERKIEQADL